MSRLPTPGSDNGQWGEILNNFLAVEHNSDGTLKRAAEITAAGSAVHNNQKGQANGVASLDGTTKVPLTQLPNALITKSSNSADTGKAIDAYTGNPISVVVGGISDIPGLQASLNVLQKSASAATDAELASAVATLNTAISLKQDAAVSATDSELAAAVTIINNSLAAKQDSSGAATDSELAAAVTTINTAVNAKADAATTAAAIAAKTRAEVDGVFTSTLLITSTADDAAPLKSGKALRYTPQMSLTGTSQGTLDEERAVPIFVPASTAISGLSINVTTSAVGAFYRLGLRSDDGGFPGGLLFGSGQLDCSTTGEKIATYATTLARGWYWVSATPQGVLATIRCIQSGFPQVGVSAGSDGTAFGFIANCYHATGISAALPTAWPTIANSNINAPRVALIVP